MLHSNEFSWEFEIFRLVRDIERKLVINSINCMKINRTEMSRKFVELILEKKSKQSDSKLRLCIKNL